MGLVRSPRMWRSGTKVTPRSGLWASSSSLTCQLGSPGNPLSSIKEKKLLPVTYIGWFRDRTHLFSLRASKPVISLLSYKKLLLRWSISCSQKQGICGPNYLSFEARQHTSDSPFLTPIRSQSELPTPINKGLEEHFSYFSYTYEFAYQFTYKVTCQTSLLSYYKNT